MLFFLGISLPLVISAAGKIFINRTSAEHIIVPGRAATDSDARRAVVSTVYAQEPDDGNSKKKKYKPTRKVKFVPVGPNAGTYCDPYTRHYYPNLCPTPEQQQGEIPKAEWDPKSFPSSAGVLAPSFMQMDMYHHQYQYPGQVGPSQLTKQKPTQFPNQLPEPKGGGGFPAAYGYFWPSGSPYGAYSQSGYDPKTGIPYDLGYAYQYAVLKPGDRPDLTGIHPGEEGTKTTKSRAGRFAAAAAKWTGGGDGLMGGLTKGLGKIAGGRMQGVVQSLASDFAGDLLSQAGVDQFGSLLGGMTDSFMGHLEAVVSPDGLAGHASEQIKSTMIGLAEADMAKDNAFPAFQDTLSSVLVGFGRSLAQNYFGEEGGNMATILTEKVPQLLRSVLKDTKA
ncbi:unnamed protein product [Vitrella brassicaformis CCMP3155]|uniref:Uncharacterized protein n=1 Tax=Vitrella brassicaformis (strain CCMP3155) TaxID=1169540 RepID=A0A0G4ERF6_VITBC|nr:unnamed protein product [Vitrella brassicaformis CCMP3155]|eukprot:CEL99987.1 unnamed protein product [Vitrella brassicaformis CCMP3155]